MIDLQTGVADLHYIYCQINQISTSYDRLTLQGTPPPRAHPVETD